MFYKQGPFRRWICTSFDTQRWSGGSYIRSQSWFRTAGGKWNGITCLFCWQSVLKRSSLTQANSRPWLSQAPSTLQSQPLESTWTCLHLQSVLQSRLLESAIQCPLLHGPFLQCPLLQSAPKCPFLQCPLLCLCLLLLTCFSSSSFDFLMFLSPVFPCLPRPALFV